MRNICVLILVIILSATLYAKQVIIINSYNLNDPYVALQIRGFKDAIFSKHFIWLDGIHLRSHTKDIHGVRHLSKHILTWLGNQDATIVYTIGDSAFEHIGIPASHSNCVIAANLHKSLLSYPGLKKDHIIAIEERPHLDKLFRLFDKAHFNPTYYVITESPRIATDTCYYITQHILAELQNKRIEIYEVEHIIELRELLEQLNDKPTGVLIVTLQCLPGEQRMLTKRQIVDEITAYNIKHLEVAYDPTLCEHGISICISPHPYIVGTFIGSIINTYLETNKFKPEIIQLRTCITVNVRRLDQLGFSHLYEVGAQYIDRYVE